MWVTAGLLLGLATASCATEGGSRRLPSPRNVRIDRSIDDIIVVHWDLEIPPNVQTSEIEFVFLLEAEGRAPRKFYRRFGSAPFNFMIQYIYPLTRYKLSITATSPDWEDSIARREYFDTMPSGPPRLAAPTNLRFDLGTVRTQQTVVLHWDFKKPENLSLRKIEFVLFLEAEGRSLRKFYPKFSRAPFNYSFPVSPNTNYTVYLKATSPNWISSEQRIGNFFSLSADWPTPIITDVKPTARANFIEYHVTWEIEPTPDLLEFFEVRVCDEHCFAYNRDSSVNAARVPVAFHSPWNITVVAFFNSRSIKFVERESERRRGWSRPGNPRKVPETHAQKSNGSIKLGWHPPFHPRGPTSYYEVFVCDPNNGTSESQETIRQENDLGYTRLDGGAYESILDLNVSESAPVKVDQCSPPAPILFVVVKRAPGCARFRAFFRKPELDSFYTVDEGFHERQLNLGPEVAESFNLSPYTSINVGIRSCIAHIGDESRRDICGNLIEFDLLSNVAAPGRVRRPNIYYEDIDVVTLEWKVPSKTRGPIDGYRIVIEETHRGNALDGKKVVHVETLNRTESTFTFMYDRENTYLITIAAFNLDLDDRTIEHLGEWYQFPKPTTTKPGDFSWQTITAFIIAIAIMFMIAFYFMDG